MLLDKLALLDPPQPREVAKELRTVAETFAEVVRRSEHRPHTGWWPTCSIGLTGVDPFLRGCLRSTRYGEDLWHLWG